jgi:phospholipid/cholesterol/gamma-HCH transport system permease protein
MSGFVTRLGATALEQFRGWGHAAFFFLDLLRAIPASLKRLKLIVQQIYAIGNRSLIIICASGLAVGFVLALQMYYALVTYGAAESLGAAVRGPRRHLADGGDRPHEGG